MTPRRLGRTLIGIVIAMILMGLVLPRIGFPPSRTLPPSHVYDTAVGRTVGVITGTHDSPSSNPFRVGEHFYFIDYDFQAPDPADPKQTQTYHGSVQAPKDIQSGVQAGGGIDVKYEKTNPEINGVRDAGLGRSVLGASSLLSGWLIWPILAVILGIGIGELIGRFGPQEDI